SAPPAFESAAADIVIVPGQPVQGQDVITLAFPFLINLHPAPGDSVPGPVAVTFTIADAVVAIDPASITIDITQAGSTIGPLTPALIACDDAGANPCSPAGALGVTGFHASAGPFSLTLGTATVHIHAQDLGPQPRVMDFTFTVNVLAPLATVTPTTTA